VIQCDADTLRSILPRTREGILVGGRLGRKSRKSFLELGRGRKSFRRQKILGKVGGVNQDLKAKETGRSKITKKREMQ